MCDILSAISYGLYPQHHQHLQQQQQQHHHHPELLRPLKKFKVNMTIPSRPAPPPPQASTNKTNRYSPATNWDDTPFSNPTTVKKAPPPRPPPPKVVPALKKPGQAQSINILSNLFGQKRAGAGSKPPVSQKPVLTKLPPPPKLPPPNGYGSFGASAATPSNELISFDSPPSSPTFTQKSCSDCISVDSFSSDSNYSSPNNGNMSQAESGFEDDFVVSTEHGSRSKVTTPATTISNSSSRDLWDLSDPFGMPTSSTNTIYAPVGSATIRVPAVNSKLYETEFFDPLCNGKTVAPKVQTIAKPTIIKTAAAFSTNSSSSASSSQKSTPTHHHLELKPKPVLAPPVWSIKPSIAPIPPAAATSFDDADAEESLDSLPSLPMPNIPPPPPPVCVDEDDDGDVTGNGAAAPQTQQQQQQRQEPYGIAMYDFNGETDEDLSFRTNDKIYLLKRLNEEWLLGRDRRGCEGMFPANYIEVRIALPGDHQSTAATSNSSSSSSHTNTTTPSFNPPKVRVLYTFNAETAEDLTIVENEFVTVLHQITAEWLYGECHGQRGQFPANFIEYVPPNLPLVPPANGV